MAVQGNGLVANDAGRAIRRCRIPPMSVHVRFGACHKESTSLMHHMQAAKIDVAAIHDIDGAGFRDEEVKGMDVGQFSVRNM